MSAGGFGYDPFLYLPNLDIGVKFAIATASWHLRICCLYWHSDFQGLFMSRSEASNLRARTYRMNSGQRVVGIVLLTVGLFFPFAIWYGVLSGAREPKFFEMSFPVAYLAIAGYATTRAFKNRVRLSESSIEVHTLKGNAVLPLDKIKGRRRYVNRGDLETPDVRHLVLEPNDDRFPKLDIQETYNFDDFFYCWFNALPDLDASDKTKPDSSNFGLV